MTGATWTVPGCRCRPLQVYRCIQALQSTGRWDDADEIEADLERQYEAAAERENLERVDLGGNVHVWRRVSEVLQ